MSDSPLPELSIVVPAFREAGRLPATLGKLGIFARDCGFPVEVLIVVEAGSDGTLEIAQRFAAAHREFAALDSGVHRGKGHAVRCGMLSARGGTVLFMDADLSVPLAEVPKFLQRFAVEPDIDVLIGDRQHEKSDIVVRQNWLRERMGQVFNRLVRRLAGLQWPDTQCGFKAFRRSAAQTIFNLQTIDCFAFDVEVLLLAERLGFRVKSMPVVWINSKESKVRIVQDSFRMLCDIFRVRRSVERAMRRKCETVPSEAVVAE